MGHLEKLIELSLRYVIEPGLYWVLNHPIISVAVIIFVVYASVRNYRML